MVFDFWTATVKQNEVIIISLFLQDIFDVFH
jgi:hypothetical protein